MCVIILPFLEIQYTVAFPAVDIVFRSIQYAQYVKAVLFKGALFI